MELEIMACPNCGGHKLNKTADGYYCPHCGFTSTDVTLARAIEQVRSAIGDVVDEVLFRKKEEEVANVRRSLYEETHREFLDERAIVSYCREMKKHVPNDFLANFYEIALGDNVVALNDFLSKSEIDGSYADVVLGFLIKLINPNTLLLINEIISNAYEKTDIKKYTYWQDKYQAESQKVDDAVYDVTLPRDVFVAYKSEDMADVIAVVDYLEQQEGLTCFVAARNLQHGRVGDYDKKLEQALDSCRALLFVSSQTSRKTGDARRKELPYVRKQDFARAGGEYGALNDYRQIPTKYKQRRVEYVVEEYGDSVAEKYVAEFFDGYERCYDFNAVAASLFRQLDNAYTEDAPSFKYCLNCGAENAVDVLFCKQCGNREFGTKQDYEQRKLDEQKASAERKRLEQQRAEEQKRLEEQQKIEQRKNLEEQRKLDEQKAAAAKAAAAQQSAFNVKPTVQPKPVQQAQPAIKYDPSKFQIKNGVLVKCLGNDSNVVIPDGVTVIRESAFLACSSLKSVTIPSSVTTIANGAFYDCKKLNSVYYSGDIESWCNINFRDGCSNPLYYAHDLYINNKLVTELIIPNTVTEIKDFAFYKCSCLTNITMPNSVRTINKFAFSACSSLTSITIPNSVSTIGDYAFSNCSGLSEVTISNSVTTIGESAFTACSSLKSVTIPSRESISDLHPAISC